MLPTLPTFNSRRPYYADFHYSEALPSNSPPAPPPPPPPGSQPSTTVNPSGNLPPPHTESHVSHRGRFGYGYGHGPGHGYGHGQPAPEIMYREYGYHHRRRGFGRYLWLPTGILLTYWLTKSHYEKLHHNKSGWTNWSYTRPDVPSNDSQPKGREWRWGCGRVENKIGSDALRSVGDVGEERGLVGKPEQKVGELVIGSRAVPALVGGDVWKEKSAMEAQTKKDEAIVYISSRIDDLKSMLDKVKDKLEGHGIEEKTKDAMKKII